MLLIGLLIGMRGEWIGKAAAIPIFFGFLPSGRGYVVFYESNGFGFRWFFSKILSTTVGNLNTTSKRKYALWVPVGVVLMTLSYLLYGSHYGYYGRITTSLHYWRHLDFSQLVIPLLFWSGGILVLLGLIFSFAYDLTIGKIKSWVNGNPN